MEKRKGEINSFQYLRSLNCFNSGDDEIEGKAKKTTIKEESESIIAKLVQRSISHQLCSNQSSNEMKI